MKKKYLYFYILLLFFIALLYIFLSDDKYNEISFLNTVDYDNLKNEIILTKKKNFNIIASISVDNKICQYDDFSDSFLCYLNKNDAKRLNLVVNSTLNYSLISDASYIITNDDVFSVVMYTDKYYYILNLKFTNMPILSINSLPELSQKYNDFISIDLELDNPSEDKKVFDSSNSYMSLIEDDYRVIRSKIDFQLRGHDSLIYDKKSYKLNLKKYKDNVLINNDLSLLGMYKDDDWVLDAMYIDFSKIRNKLSSDLWRMISNQDILNGKYVELFINQKYCGLYLLKEPLNNKSLHVGETGAIFKSVLYLNIDDQFVNNVGDKYYLLKGTNGYNSSSKKIIDVMNRYYYDTYNHYDISEYVFDNFDLNNFLNYKVFIAFIKGVDNNEYNNYYYYIQNKDGKLVKVPWDMDLTFGLTFNRVYEYENVDDMGFDIYYYNSPELNNLIKQRYNDLRKNKLSIENINSYLDEYKEQLLNSGASKRDSERWYQYDVEQEIENVRTWIYARIMYLDDFFK